MSAWACRSAFLAYKRPDAHAGDGKRFLSLKMAPPGSRWWQATDEADLDYGFDSDDLDRFAEPNRTSRLTSRDPRDTRHRDIERRDTETDERGVIENMSSWFQRQAGAQSSQLATTAVLSGAAVAGAIFGYQAYRRKEAVNDLKSSIPDLDEQHHAEKVGLPCLSVQQLEARLTKG